MHLTFPPFSSLIRGSSLVQAAVKFWALDSGLSKVNPGESLHSIFRDPQRTEMLWILGKLWPNKM